MSDNGAIVVGVDGSLASLAALNWAAVEAAKRDRPLDAVIVAEPTSNGTTAATETLDQVKMVAVEHPEIQIRYVHLTGAPGPALTRAASGAELLVVGTRGRSRLAVALLGSVSTYCAVHADCPVVIVPDPDRPAVSTDESTMDEWATPGPLL